MKGNGRSKNNSFIVNILQGVRRPPGAEIAAHAESSARCTAANIEREQLPDRGVY